ncbi:YwmB family TATA-box binding protein [Clostridium aestuarii]|uniref:YwmB family TATA-box binding protein n=1 Tax=Clostridium aestuarii TaxID=338193 RepID=A0ABT4D629_9CLOT|nr:YwmB family TATA-box binding protein [Clostridium aestuarii]MCY6485630.1 YwmB family TATA-box binding protein [Clostridium aestuarii]
MKADKLNKSIILVLLALVLLNYKFSYAFKKENLFGFILKETKAQVNEYGIKTRFKVCENGQGYYKYFLNKIKVNKPNYKIKTNYSKRGYSISFTNSRSKGYIEEFSIEGKKIITINIIKKDNENKLTELKSQIKAIVNSIPKENIVSSQYIKARIPEENLKKENSKVINLLKNEGAVNINSIKINNGFSTTAYTCRYIPKKNNGKLMDFNFALCNYSSGNYIIMGTPEIITTY